MWPLLENRLRANRLITVRNYCPRVAVVIFTTGMRRDTGVKQLGFTDMVHRQGTFHGLGFRHHHK